MFSQHTIIDSTAIAFKAKLFTLSEYGISDEEKIINDIENQNAFFLKTMYKHFLFIKIEFSQPYRIFENGTRTLFRNCNYYIAYNINDAKFYRLGGFNSIDIDSFIKDLEQIEISIFLDISEGKEIDEINIYCLYDYFKMNPKKRFKKGFSCLCNCEEETQTMIISK